MRITSRTILPAAIVALLCLLTALPADAQSSNRPNIGSVQILIRDIQTRQEIARINPGETVTLPEGARVRLNLMAIPTGSARNPVYPATEFTDVSRGGVRITRSNEENAAADLEIVASRNPNRVETIRYQVTETWVPANLRTGSFQVRVGPAGANTQGTYSWSSDRARDLTRLLYQGILMREPDAGASGTIDSIQRGGYDALVRAAVGIADSDESRIRVYEQKGVCNEQRLLALYKNLLGLTADQVDRRQWDADLRRMNSGEIARVVDDIVRSDRFRSRYEAVASAR
jgi:hypothetical protein